MPFAEIRGIAIRYEIVGSDGPWVALATGGRNPYGEFVPLAERIARQGFRVVLHDRRNCGQSQVALDPSMGEDNHRVEDWHALLTHLGATPAFVGGSSSGCRMSLLYALKRPELVRGLLLMRVTGGAYPAKRLPEQYYDQFIRAAHEGGMPAVRAMDHWKACMEANPDNARILSTMPVERFVSVMTKWRDEFVQGVNLPVVGVSREEMGSIRVPSIIVPGNDQVHSHASGKLAHSLIPGSRLYELPLVDTGADLVPFVDWAPVYDELASAFVAFMREQMEKGR